MSRPLRVQYPGAVYHVTCRGNERKEIFRSNEDRTTFLELLRDSQEIYQVILYSWVLMENHFHLLIGTPLGNLDQFMRRFNISYTGYFNRKHNRAGHLYQGRYKSILVEKESYLSELSRYIHLNPIRVQGMGSMTSGEKMKFLLPCPWSTLGGYLDERKKVAGVDYTLILGEFGGDHPIGRQAYRKRIREDIQGELEIQGKIVGGSLLGREGFIGWVKTHFLAKGLDQEYTGFRRIKSYKARKKILETVKTETGRTEAELVAEKGDMRRMAMELLYRLGGLNGVEIGNIFKVSYNAVSQERKRLTNNMKLDPKLKKYFASLLRQANQ